MISKVISGQSFKRLCEYLCKNQGRAQVIGSAGIRDYHYALMAEDFERQRGLNRNLKSPVLHMILSYYPGEQITDEMMLKIAKEYLEMHGIKNTQYAIIKHNDRKHPHTHLIVNRIDNNGKTKKDGWIGYKGKKIAQELTRKYGLKMSEKKTLKLTQLERRNEYEVIRFTIYQTIHELLPVSVNLKDFKASLEKQHIEMLYKYNGTTAEIQGISFQVGNFKYKGSEIDRQFSYRNLVKSLTPKLLTKNQTKRELAKQLLDKSHGEKNSLLEQLLRPERTNNYVPYEFKKKKRGLR